VLARFVLARAAAGLSDSTIRSDVLHLEQLRAWFGGPLWDMEPAMACQLKLSGRPAGAPCGKPQAGSVRKTPAAISPTPNAPSSCSPQVPARLARSTRRIPIANATDSRPAATKLATWIHPWLPRLSALIG
jgi:hypothetical protein